jgi:hypothetical protein
MARTLPNFCVVLYIVCFVSFCVLFVCICVLYYCHQVATQLQLTNIPNKLVIYKDYIEMHGQQNMNSHYHIYNLK